MAVYNQSISRERERKTDQLSPLQSLFSLSTNRQTDRQADSRLAIIGKDFGEVPLD